MAVNAVSTAGWQTPYLSQLPIWTQKMAVDLAQFLNKPTFPSGLTVGGPAALASGTINGRGIVSSFGSDTLIQNGSFSATILSGQSQLLSSFTFPTAFPTACSGVWLNVQATTHNYAADANTFTTTGFSYTLFTTNAGTVGSNVTWTLNWLAVGH